MLWNRSSSNSRGRVIRDPRLSTFHFRLPNFLFSGAFLFLNDWLSNLFFLFFFKCCSLESTVHMLVIPHCMLVFLWISCCEQLCMRFNNLFLNWILFCVNQSLKFLFGSGTIITSATPDFHDPVSDHKKPSHNTFKKTPEYCTWQGMCLTLLFVFCSIPLPLFTSWLFRLQLPSYEELVFMSICQISSSLLSLYEQYHDALLLHREVAEHNAWLVTYVSHSWLEPWLHS